jgi:hypothetical protein
MMASTNDKKQLFFVYAPDMTDKDTTQRRMANRAKHIEETLAERDSGLVRECSLTRFFLYSIVLRIFADRL